MVHICRLLAQCLWQPFSDHSVIVERHDVMQVILQDVEMRWMMQDEHLHRIPDLQAIAKRLGWIRLSYMTAIGVVEILYHIYMYCWVRPDLQSVAIWTWCIAHDSYTEKQKIIVYESINMAGQCHLVMWNPISSYILS